MIKRVVRLLLEVIVLPLLLLAALIARFRRRPFDVGIGPEPLLNAIYHKRALEEYGYRAETFVTSVYFITDDFDVRFDQWPRPVRALVTTLCGVFVFCVFRYRALYFYFNGGPLGHAVWLWRLEPALLRLAGVRTVVLPYGADIQDMSRASNLLFKAALVRDYPTHHHRRHRIRANVDMWSRHADHVIAGNEWVDFLHFWHTLMVAHFTIDTNELRPAAARQRRPGDPLRILHAPNHRAIKGTEHFVRAVEELRAEGVAIELTLVQGLPNREVRRLMEQADVVADQLVMGWYAQFAIEGMALAKPVLCWLRPDLKELFTQTGLLTLEEPPIVECSFATVKQTIRELAAGARDLHDIGRRSRAYVERVHSTTAVGSVFDRVNRELGVAPSGAPKVRNHGTRPGPAACAS